MELDITRYSSWSFFFCGAFRVVSGQFSKNSFQWECVCVWQRWEGGREVMDAACACCSLIYLYPP